MKTLKPQIKKDISQVLKSAAIVSAGFVVAATFTVSLTLGITSAASADANTSGVATNAPQQQAQTLSLNTRAENALVQTQTAENTLSYVGLDMVYRLYNPATSEHLWTTSWDESHYLPQVGWQQESIGWYCPETSSKAVYRLYNAGLGTHHYTANKTEADDLVANHGWTYDNNGQAQFYSAESSDAGAKPVYRLYNDGLSQHHYTLDKNEYDNLTKNHGWSGEGIDFYAYEESYAKTYYTIKEAEEFNADTSRTTPLWLEQEDLDNATVVLSTDTVTYTADGSDLPKVLSVTLADGRKLIEGVDYTYTTPYDRAGTNVVQIYSADPSMFYYTNREYTMLKADIEPVEITIPDQVEWAPELGKEFGDDIDFQTLKPTVGDTLADVQTPTEYNGIFGTFVFDDPTYELTTSGITSVTATFYPQNKGESWSASNYVPYGDRYNPVYNVTLPLDVFEPYWLATASETYIVGTDKNGDTVSTANMTYGSMELYKVDPNYKSAAEIKEDVKKIQAGDTETIAEYSAYKDNGNVHLYTRWCPTKQECYPDGHVMYGIIGDRNGTTRNELNPASYYCEFRVGWVGPYSDEDQDWLKGVSLSFEQTHMLSAGVSYQGVTGCMTSTYYKELQDGQEKFFQYIDEDGYTVYADTPDGAIYSRFPKGFTRDIKEITKETTWSDTGETTTDSWTLWYTNQIFRDKTRAGTDEIPTCEIPCFCF